MKIVSWNCNGAFRKKFGAIAELNADIYVIQECEDPSQCHEPAYKAWASNYLWTGSNKHKGLGVFARSDIKLTQIELEAERLQLFLPCILEDQIFLLACWTRYADSPTFGYIGQLWKYLQAHPDFLRQAEAILIGDLNSNVRWDKWDRWWNHSDVLQQLSDLGLESVYHLVSGEPQGKESKPTFYLQRNLKKAYHIDYAFLSKALIQDAIVAVGQAEHWLEYSDHMPIIVQNPAKIRAT